MGCWRTRKAPTPNVFLAERVVCQQLQSLAQQTHTLLDAIMLLLTTVDQLR